jgi:hypothetical protein
MIRFCIDTPRAQATLEFACRTTRFSRLPGFSGDNMRFLIAAVAGMGLVASASGLQAEGTVDYLRQIKPLFADKCYACHGALQQKADLRLDTVKSILDGSGKGRVVIPGQSDKSKLIDHVLARKGARLMPPATDGDPFSPAQVTLIRKWIDEGTRGPMNEKPEADPRDHWAFRAPLRPALPIPNSFTASANPIDAFIAAEWEKHRLKPQALADRRILLRRVYLDLIGLPPTRQELDAFAADASPDAFEKVVDRLLASSQYGERWGRHWMDIWRYSDWWGLGQEVRNSQKHIWHWRDWIIESLNGDNGYDQMVREMLAADELYPNDLGRLRATGYLVRPYFIFNRTTWLDETIEHTAKAFLGLTFNCAKCHDHKYDPVRQKDYYRFRAFFEPYQVRMDQVPGETDYEKDGIPRVFDSNLEAPTYVFFRGDDRQPLKDRPLDAGLPRLLLWSPLEIAPVTLPPEAHAPGLRPWVLENHLRMADRNIAVARAVLERARADLARAERKPAAPAKVKETSLFRDEFSSTDHWTLGAGKWEKSPGRLRQSFPGERRSFVQAKIPPPTDFQAFFKFAITGGEPWRSVGISFDVADSNEVLVYATAHVGGPRLQVSYKQGNDYVYPPQGSRAWPVQFNKPLEMEIRVYGNLVNVAVDNRFVLAYRLPIARKPGALQLITYAATADFLRFELAELSANAKMIEAGTQMTVAPVQPANPAQARAAVTVAEKTLAVADFEPGLFRARAKADRAKFHDTARFKELARVAAALEQQQTLSKAEEALARAELDVTRAEPAKRPEAEKKRKAAEDAIMRARKGLANPGENYTSVSGARKTPESNLETEASRLRSFPKTSSGRRSALATWLTDRRNPLAARVAVNHIWGRHFGRPLVPTIFDFGRKGTPPTHPALLDLLAVDFMEHGWSMKHLHRLIVTSRAYRLGSSTASADAKTRETDPENRWYWRMNPIRMDAQILRDSLLCLSGELDPKLCGPSVPTTDESSRRRSIYFVHSHNDNQKFLSMFDDASVRECYRRSESIVPQQALALANSQLSQAAAAKINERLHKQFGPVSDAEFIRGAFATILAAAPTAEEQAECERALRDLNQVLKGRPDAGRRARGNLLHALLNHNDFITVR